MQTDTTRPTSPNYSWITEHSASDVEVMAEIAAAFGGKAADSYARSIVVAQPDARMRVSRFELPERSSLFRNVRLVDRKEAAKKALYSLIYVASAHWSTALFDSLILSLVCWFYALLVVLEFVIYISPLWMEEDRDPVFKSIADAIENRHS